MRAELYVWRRGVAVLAMSFTSPDCFKVAGRVSMMQRTLRSTGGFVRITHRPASTEKPGNMEVLF